MMLSISEFARRLGVSRRRVRNMIRLQQVIAVRIGERWAISEFELMRILRPRKNSDNTTQSIPQ